MAGGFSKFLSGIFSSSAANGGKDERSGSPVRRQKPEAGNGDLLNGTSHQTQAGMLRSTWKLMKPYWVTEKGKKGRAYLGAVLALTTIVGMPSIDAATHSRQINTGFSLTKETNIEIKTVEDEQQPSEAAADPTKKEYHLDIHGKAFGKEYQMDLKQVSGLSVIAANLNSEFVGGIVSSGAIALDSQKHPDRYPEGFLKNEEYIKNVDSAVDALKLFTFTAALLIAASVYSSYLRQKLHLDWRTSMTGDFVDKYFQNHSYYRLQSIYGNTDNPEQRIEQDVNQFTDNTTSIPLGILQSGMLIAAFSGVLVDVSKKVKIDMGPLHFQDHGYLLWASIGLAAAAGLSAYALGRPLIKQTQEQERLNADFRSAAGRVRENAESIAFLGGEDIEKKNLMEKFKPVAENWYKIMKTNKRLGWLQSYYGNAANLVPFILMAPAVMTGSMTYADLKLASIGFDRVDAGLSWFTNSFQSLAEWKATQNRLSTHDEAVDKSISDAQYNNTNIGSQEKHPETHIPNGPA